MSQISEVFQASPNNLDGQKGSFILVYEIHTNNSSFQINQKTTNENLSMSSLFDQIIYSYLQEKMDLPDLNFTPPAEDVDEMDENAENEMEGHVGDDMEGDDGEGMEGDEIVQNPGTVTLDHSIISSLDHSITSSLDHFI